MLTAHDDSTEKPRVITRVLGDLRQARGLWVSALIGAGYEV